MNPQSNPIPQHTPTPERGAASITIELSESQIRILHGTDGVELTSPRNVTAGYWDALWDLLEHPDAVMVAKRACNSHAQLVAALEAAQNTIERMAVGLPSDSAATLSVIREALK